VAPALAVYRVGADGKPAAVRDEVSPKDELGFGYRNPAGKKRLMIFAVDEHDHVYWYQPAWTDERAEPVAVPAEGGDAEHALPRLTLHAFDGDRLRFVALLLDEPRSVRDIEARLAGGGPLRVDGATVLETQVRVAR
jgi:hypothetical protein